jgi:diguanylate cyclase (GGDEF)-like protein
MMGLIKRLLLHGIIGVFLGFAVLHPASVIIQQMPVQAMDRYKQLFDSAFTRYHAGMAIYFALLGGLFGLLQGLHTYRKKGLFDKVQKLSVTDDLTGLFNRRYLMENLEREFRRAERYGNDLALIMIDIDYFKRFNDVHGHLAGDDLLRVFADRLRLAARRTDIVARYGGEEFMILMPDTNLEMAIHLAERLRQDIEVFPFEKRETQPLGRVTVSIGCAEFQKLTVSDVDCLIHMADQCLYHAKSSGRNQIWY